MKNKIIIMFLFFSVNLFGQQVLFQNKPIDTILIRSSRSAYQFDKKGTTKGKAEYIEITYDDKKEGYIISNYYKDEYYRYIKPDTIKIKKKVYKNHLRKTITNHKIERLANSFDTIKTISTNNSILSQVELSKYIDLKKIRTIARKYEVGWNFSLRYTSKKENKDFEKNCQSIDTFKIYLAERFDTSSSYPMVTDYSNTFNVWITTNKTSFSYQGKYPNPLKQPWYYHKKEEFPISILNIDINLALEDMLPKNFFLKETISKNSIVDDYITWYLERRNIKYSY